MTKKELMQHAQDMADGLLSIDKASPILAQSAFDISDTSQQLYEALGVALELQDGHEIDRILHLIEREGV